MGGGTEAETDLLGLWLTLVECSGGVSERETDLGIEDKGISSEMADKGSGGWSAGTADEDTRQTAGAADKGTEGTGRSSR